MSTSDIASAMGFHLSSGFIANSLGVAPIVQTGNGIYWRRDQFPLICQALVTFVIAKRDKQRDG